MNRLTFFCVLAIPLIWSCNDDIDAGPIITETRNLPEYTELEVDGSYEVIINPDYDFDVRVTAPDNMMNYIETFVTGSRLVIKERSNRIDHGRILIEVSETVLERIELNGSGKITAEDTLTSPDIVAEINGSGSSDLLVDCTVLRLEIDGSGIIEAWGESSMVLSEIEGSGLISSRAIESAVAEARIEGSGSIDIYAIQSLFARIDGSGVIRYWGNPETVDTNIDGSGSIIEIN